MLAPLRPLFAVCATLLLCGSAGGQDPPTPADSRLASLSVHLAGYLEARTTTVGLDRARAELAEALASFSEQAGGGHPLEHHADLGRALWLSRGYEEQSLRPGKVTKETYADGSFVGAGLEYAFRLPRDYEPGEAAYPLIVAIPDVDERPAAHLRTHWSSSEVSTGAIVISPEMPKDRAEWDLKMANGRPGGLCHVLTALRIAGDRFAIDYDRVYVSGHGKGVPAAIAAGNYSPQRFAGVIGRAGDAGDLGPTNYRHLPTLFTGAGTRAVAFQQAVRELGFDNCTLASDGKESDVWNWVRSRERDVTPRSLKLVVGNPFPNHVYWLRVDPIAVEAWATAEVDREKNTIRIDSEGISYALLYLNDALLDLDRPVQVVRNGVEESCSLRRSLPTTLDLLYDGTSDPGCVYVTQVQLDMRADAANFLASAPDAHDAEYEQRLAAAEGLVEELWLLYTWCQASGRASRGEAVLARLLRLEPDHTGARSALGHERAAGHWFTDPEALERFRRGQDEEVARGRGYSKHKGLWMHPEDRARASKGLVKDPETGLWQSAADRARLSEGWSRQDLEWIPPGDSACVDDGSWWVDEEWLGLHEANLRHTRLDRMWRIPTAEILLHSTATRETSRKALHHMYRALEDLRRVFGKEPALPLQVALLRSEEQYDRFAFGELDGRRAPVHVGRLHIIHSAFFAESWYPRVEGHPVYAGMGVCYWNALMPHGDLYGVHSARLAVGLSYVDALDPSPKAVRRALASGAHGSYPEDHAAEKRLPAWLRYGGAVYAERYFRDETAAEDGDPLWARNWSLDNLRSRGGLRDLSELLRFRLDPDDRDDGLKLLIEAGLLVAFMVDGECEPVAEAHGRLKQALRDGRVRPSHIKAVEDALRAHAAELRSFAGL